MATKIKNKPTQRGFDKGKFKDLYGEKCSIQKSSLATDDAIWLGTEPETMTIFEDESMGKYIVTKLPKHFDVHTRMHLNRQQVAELLPLLTNFVKTGELYPE